jgi:hypothetical protein
MRTDGGITTGAFTFLAARKIGWHFRSDGNFGPADPFDQSRGARPAEGPERSRGARWRHNR